MGVGSFSLSLETGWIFLLGTASHLRSNRINARREILIVASGFADLLEPAGTLHRRATQFDFPKFRRSGSQPGSFCRQPVRAPALVLSNFGCETVQAGQDVFGHGFICLCSFIVTGSYI